MLNLLWNTNIYSDVASLAISGKEEDGQRVFAGNLVTSTIVVGDLRPKRKPEDSIEVATMITGKGRSVENINTLKYSFIQNYEKEH